MNPSVCCVMLTADRPELARKAVECFKAQTYDLKRLCVIDTGRGPCGLSHLHSYRIAIFDCRSAQAHEPRTIGELRNMAGRCVDGADILIHWDDDDYSHPNRIAEQVALLQDSGAEVVGYNEMLFWRTPQKAATFPASEAVRGLPLKPEAWLYSNPGPPAYALGTSLCHWRKTWERHHFADETQGVEDHWLREKKLVSISANGEPYSFVEQIETHESLIYQTFRPGPVHHQTEGNEPRMIARIHGGNTSNAYRLEEHIGDGSKQFPRECQWKRVPEWDDRVREILK